MLELGMQILEEQDLQHPLLLCKFCDRGKYLRKSLMIKDDLTPDLLVHAQQACHAQIAAMHAVCKKLSWSTLKSTCRIYMKYVASTWMWYSSLIQPLDKYLNQVSVMQRNHLIALLKLFVPERFEGESAHTLLRTRRRAIITLLHARPHCCVHDCLLIRKWHYLGHILRMPLDSITSLALQTGLQEGTDRVPAIRQRRSGPYGIRTSSGGWALLVRFLRIDVLCLSLIWLTWLPIGNSGSLPGQWCQACTNESGSRCMKPCFRRGDGLCRLSSHGYCTSMLHSLGQNMFSCGLIVHMRRSRTRVMVIYCTLAKAYVVTSGWAQLFRSPWLSWQLGMQWKRYCRVFLLTLPRSCRAVIW